MHRTNVALGAILLIAAVAGFVIVPEHAPGFLPVYRITANETCPGGGIPIVGPGGAQCQEGVTKTGLPQTTYDALRIVTWALLIVGALAVALGLIG